MIATLENTSGRTINDYDVINNNYTDGPADLYAEGGNRTDPVPYPFSHIDPLADTDTIDLPMHPADFRRQHVMQSALEPAAEWQQLIQSGVATLAFAAEVGVVDAEEIAVGTV